MALEGLQNVVKDRATVTATIVSEGVAIAYNGGLAATNAVAVKGVSTHKAAINDVIDIVKLGMPTRLRITLGQVIAVGDPLGIGATAGQFSKITRGAGGGILAWSRGVTTGSGEEYVEADFCNLGFLDAVS